MLPTETDLNTLPVVSNLPEKVLPISAAVQSKFKGGKFLFIAFCYINDCGDVFVMNLYTD